MFIAGIHVFFFYLISVLIFFIFDVADVSCVKHSFTRASQITNYSRIINCTVLKSLKFFF